uniref:Plasminogen receptor (KT) n=1 Tax=Oncorhynchus tshawytscha TaxID=74940 RepID=A0AAZ3P0A9_ONCTS
MGFMLSKSMDQNFKKQQEFMLHNARLQMERQILMQNQMRERQMAMQIAWSREFLKYYGTFFSLAALGLTIGAIKKKKPVLFAPVVPLSFVLAYQMDMAYGTLIYRMRANQKPSKAYPPSDKLKDTLNVGKQNCCCSQLLQYRVDVISTIPTADHHSLISVSWMKAITSFL